MWRKILEAAERRRPPQQVRKKDEKQQVNNSRDDKREEVGTGDDGAFLGESTQASLPIPPRFVTESNDGVMWKERSSSISSSSIATNSSSTSTVPLMESASPMRPSSSASTLEKKEWRKSELSETSDFDEEQVEADQNVAELLDKISQRDVNDAKEELVEGEEEEEGHEDDPLLDQKVAELLDKISQREVNVAREEEQRSKIREKIRNLEGLMMTKKREREKQVVEKVLSKRSKPLKKQTKPAPSSNNCSDHVVMMQDDHGSNESSPGPTATGMLSTKKRHKRKKSRRINASKRARRLNEMLETEFKKQAFLEQEHLFEEARKRMAEEVERQRQRNNRDRTEGKLLETRYAKETWLESCGWDANILRFSSCDMIPDPTSSDPFQCLGLFHHATSPEIRSRFKRLALMFHPDKNNRPGASETFCSFNAAYNLLMR